MANIIGIKVNNFRGLRDVTVGSVWLGPKQRPLTPMTVIIGKNGVGKSTLFDIFGFLADALKFGVEEACDLRGRGGFEKIHSQGKAGNISIEIAYVGNDSAHPFHYSVSINADNSGRPYVEEEYLLKYLGKSDDVLSMFLLLQEGVGCTLKDGPIDGFDPDRLDELLDALVKKKKEEPEREHFDLLQSVFREKKPLGAMPVSLDDNRKLGIATLGALKQHPQIVAFRQFIEGWYLSYFTPDAARTLPLSGAQQHLNSKGDNLANVVQFMEREHRDSFQSILDRIAEKIPGIDKIRTEKTLDGRLLLCFNDQGFQDPFYAPQMSDGTLKVFAYLLLLEDPNPPPFICIEEPENGLYHKLLETLAAEFREHATGRKGGSQLFITTHQPYFVDALDPEEVWILEKGADGFSTIRRASDDELVKNMVAEGLPLGGLWYSDYLDAR